MKSSLKLAAVVIAAAALVSCDGRRVQDLEERVAGLQQQAADTGAAQKKLEAKEGAAAPAQKAKAGGASGAHGVKDGVFPSDVSASFLKACVKKPGRGKAVCECMLEKIQETFDPDVFARMAGKWVARSAPEELREIIAVCGGTQ